MGTIPHSFYLCASNLYAIVGKRPSPENAQDDMKDIIFKAHRNKKFKYPRME
jgi:hypothetical protein